MTHPDGHPVSQAKPPFIPEYAPAPIREQVRELRKQLAIVNNLGARQDRHGRGNPAAIAAELQVLQSALHTVEAVESIVGPEARLSADQLRQRLVLRPDPT